MNPDFEIEHLDPKELRANPLNFRRHPDLQRSALEQSISEHGWLSAPILNRRSGNLLDGHARVELAVEKEEALIPVRVIDVPIAQEKRILRAFDRIGGMAEEDPQALDRLIEEIGDVDLERLLGEITEPASGLLPEADPDAIPEVVETRAKAGDLWMLGEHRLLCGDCTVATDVERLMQGSGADMIWSDPPYGLGGYAGRTDKFIPVTGDDADAERLRDFFLAGDADEVYVCCEFRTYPHLLAARGVPRSLIVWAKPSFGMGNGYRRQHEFIGYYGAYKGTTESDLWSEGRDDDYQHPTQKPVALPIRAIANSSVAGDIVYDPFAGSGTTLIACEQTGRVARCIEIEPRYVDVCLARWEQATGKQARLVE